MMMMIRMSNVQCSNDTANRVTGDDDKPTVKSGMKCDCSSELILLAVKIMHSQHERAVTE